MRTLTPIRCNHRRNRICTSSRSKRARRFPQSCDRPPQKMQNYRLLYTPRLGRAVERRNQRFLNIKPFKKGLFEPKSGDNSRNDSNRYSGTFLKFSTLKILPCSAARFSNFQLQKFCYVLREVPHFSNLLARSLDFQLLSFWGICGLLLGFRVRVRV